MRRRLSVLAEKDDVSAGHIESALEVSIGTNPQFQNRLTARERACSWLTANPGPHDVLILPGVSCPEDITELINLVPQGTKIILLERNLIRATHLFIECPLEKYVSEERLFLAFGECEDWIDHQLISMLYLPDSPTIGICEFSDPGQADSEFYTVLLMKIRERIRLKAYHLSTLIHLGPIWQFNAIKNLPYTLNNPGIKDLDNLFAGRPALVVAAGPSLNDALPHIAEVRSNFVIISVGTALKPLRNAGIRPDIVVSIDASRKTGPQFHTRCDDLFLACSSFAFPAILPAFRGIFSGHASADPVGEWISSLGYEKGPIMSGGTVTATALELAVSMGCDPVIAIGLDLCMSDDGSTHASNSMYHGERVPKVHLVPVPGNYSEKVSTTVQFLTYVEAISDYVTNIRKGKLFINANTGGAKIDGMELIKPEEIKRYARGIFDAYEEIARKYTGSIPCHEGKYINEIESVLTDLTEIAADSMSAGMLCNNLIMMLRSPYRGDYEEAEELLRTLNEIDERTMARKEASAILNMSLRPAFFTLGNLNNTSDRKKIDGLSSIRNSKTLYEQTAGAAKWTGQLLEDSLKEIKARYSRQKQETTLNNLHVAV